VLTSEAFKVPSVWTWSAISSHSPGSGQAAEKTRERERSATTTQIPNEPVVIMGDVNTPSDSVQFRTLRKKFRNAFETGGRGNVTTWPMPCPVLAIDHIWTSGRVEVPRAWHVSSLQSDQAAVIAELSFSE
jgi:vancomycin resistance protein VanJ